MILADVKSVGEGVIERLATPQVRTLMQKLAVLLRPLAGRGQRSDQPIQILELITEPAAAATPAPAPTSSAPPSRAEPPVLNVAGSGAKARKPALSAQAVADVLEFELTTQTPIIHIPDEAGSIGSLEAHPAKRAAALVESGDHPSQHRPAVEPPILQAAPPPHVTETASSRARHPAAAAGSHALPTAATGVSRTLQTSATTTSRTMGGTTNNNRALAAGLTGTTQTLQLPEGLSLILEVQPFSKLRAGGRTRRYEVIARSSQHDSTRLPAGFDKYVLMQLLTWLGNNRAAWNSEPTSFTLNMTIATLEDERFPQFVASNLKAHGIAPDNIGFEIAEPLCLQRRALVERFISLCDKLGCFVVIDDFSLESSLLGVLRSKALRLVKIDPKLTSVALKDKLSQAMVVAITQAAKVLGIHCCAKAVESTAALQWLTAIGCDFAQGSAVGRVHPLESLGQNN